MGNSCLAPPQAEEAGGRADPAVPLRRGRPPPPPPPGAGYTTGSDERGLRALPPGTAAAAAAEARAAAAAAKTGPLDARRFKDELVGKLREQYARRGEAPPIGLPMKPVEELKALYERMRGEHAP